MLRVAEQYAGTDTGRQRRANEDSLLARAPLYVIADGMGGARAGEVASRIAVESFARGLGDAPEPAAALGRLVREANARIHDRSQRHADEAGMGTTLTAMYVGEEEVSIAHVGDSRAYRMREGSLERLTDDHSLVDEMIREGRLTPEEAFEHPQRSVITRALGNENDVDVDLFSVQTRAGDLYLLCSDGLTDMIGEALLGELLSRDMRLRDAGEALIAAANDAGGRDNITVVLVRIESVDVPLDGRGATRAPAATSRTAVEESADTETHATVARADGHEEPEVAAVTPRRPRRGPTRATPPKRGRARARRWTVLAALAVILALISAGAYVATQSVYFLGTNGRGLVTLFRGLPVRLPGGIALYSSDYVSGVSASTLVPPRRRKLLDHSLRSEANAVTLLRSVELGQVE